MEKKDYKYECPVCHVPRPFPIVHEKCKKDMNANEYFRNEHLKDLQTDWKHAQQAYSEAQQATKEAQDIEHQSLQYLKELLVLIDKELCSQKKTKEL